MLTNSNSFDHNVGIARAAPDAGFILDRYGASDPSHVALGDFNGDRKLDIAFIDDGGAGLSLLRLLIGAGDGTFQTIPNQYANFNATSLTVADFNGDGNADVIITQQNAGGGGSLRIWLGQPDAGLAGQGAVAIASDPLATTYPAWVGASDLNGDGLQDVLVMHVCTANCSGAHRYMSYFLGRGDGTFGPEFSKSGFATSQLAAIADFNNDGKPDLLFLDSSSSIFNVQLQSGCLP